LVRDNPTNASDSLSVADKRPQDQHGPLCESQSASVPASLPALLANGQPDAFVCDVIQTPA
jgi:hypothetical protein